MTRSNSTPLEGRRILLLEDHPLIAVELTMSLQEMGASVFSPKTGDPVAMQRLSSDDAINFVDAAVLDIDLGDRTCEEVARRLRRLGIPFVLHTGNGQSVLDLEVGHDAPVVMKPAHSDEIVSALAKVLDL